MTILIDLIERGYFPQEVQPPFVTASLAAHVAATGAPQLVALAGTDKWCSLSRHNLARAGGLRRPLSVPNPIGYVTLAANIDNAWTPNIEPLLTKATMSASRPIHSAGARAFQHVGAGKVEHLRAAVRRGARYLLRADIQNFYPSVYTHSVSWALHGKAFAKANKRNAALAGNAIDRALQSCQDGQTGGLPIGPDASLVVAECLLASVEDQLRSRLPKLKGYRWIDDFELAFTSIGQAEDALCSLQEILATYELSLNPRKTRTVELPEPQEPARLAQLRSWEFKYPPKRQASELIAYFDVAFEGISGNRGSTLASYAVSRLRSVDCHPENWELLQSLLIQTLVAEPSCARFVTYVFAIRAAAGLVVDHAAFAEATESIVVRHAPLGHGSEVAWMLWGSITNKVAITRATADAVVNMDDNLVALLALHAADLKLVPSGLVTTRWEALMTADQLRRENWLLAYEARLKNWLPSFGTADHIAADAFFASLRAAGVTFYDTTATTLPAALGGAMQSGGGQPLMSGA